MNKKKSRTVIAIASLLLIAAIGGVGVFAISQRNRMPEATVVLYDGPETLEDATADDLENVSESSRDFAIKHCVDTVVKVNGQECYVYDTNVNHTRT